MRRLGMMRGRRERERKEVDLGWGERCIQVAWCLQQERKRPPRSFVPITLRRKEPRLDLELVVGPELGDVRPQLRHCVGEGENGGQREG
jgi:hypothetical protein